MTRFRYCLNTSTIRSTPLLDKIRVAGETGYAAIELWHDDIDEYLERGGSLPELRRELEQQNLELATTIYLRRWFDSHGDDFTQAWRECRRRMEVAAELGAHYVIASPPAGPADYDLGAERYRQLLELGDALGVWPIMEFLGFVEDLNTIEKALVVLEKCGHPRATTVLDPFHISRGGGPLASLAKLKREQIAISHFNDIPASPDPATQQDSDRVFPGDGTFDLATYLRLLSQTGYNRWLSLELFRGDLWEQDPREVARVGLEKMQAVVASSLGSA